MEVKLQEHIAPLGRLLAFLALAGSVGVVARAQNPSSAQNPFWGSVTVQPVTGEPLKLSLDDAVQRGLKNNLGLKEVENEEKTSATVNIDRQVTKKTAHTE